MFQSLLETIAGGMRLTAEQIEFIRSLWMLLQATHSPAVRRTNLPRGQPVAEIVPNTQPNSTESVEFLDVFRALSQSK
jgi:hypothetical protein